MFTGVTQEQVKSGLFVKLIEDRLKFLKIS